MVWRETLMLEGRGSFRGKLFYVGQTSIAAGRKTVVHNFPGRSAPSVEDMGRASRELTLACYVLGEDYDTESRALRLEFETPGSGLLIHPYWGEMQVVVTSPVSVSVTPDEGGMARFTLTVVEIEDSVILGPTLDFGTALQIPAASALANIRSNFETVFTVVSAIEDVRNAATGIVQNAIAAVKAIRAPLNAAINLIDDVESSIDAFYDTVNTLLDTPGQLADSMVNIFNGMFGGLVTFDQDTVDEINNGQAFAEPIAGSKYSEDFRAAKALEAFDDSVVILDDASPVNTTTGASQATIEAANQEAIKNMVQLTAAVEAAKSMGQIAYSSRDKALEARDRVSEVLDRLAPTTDDATYASMVDLRAALSAQLASVAANLPSIRSIEPIIATPSLVLAYDLYGRIDLEQDIIARNNIANPSSIPSRIPLQVLSDG